MELKRRTLYLTIGALLFFAISALAYNRFSPKNGNKIFENTSSEVSQVEQQQNTSETGAPAQQNTEGQTEKSGVPGTSSKVNAPVAGGNAPAQSSNVPQTTQPPANPNQNQGKTKAPDIAVYDAGGKKVKLSDFLGKPVVINIWASWCGPCKEELPSFQKVYKELGNNVKFMMVDMTDGQRETKTTGQNYVSSQGFTFPLYFDLDRDAATKFAAKTIPTSIFVNKDGYIEARVTGSMTESQLRQKIALINK